MAIWGEGARPSANDLTAFGMVDGYRVVNKFGRNPDIDTGSAPEDVWAEVSGGFDVLLRRL